jgi:hypothetical protein
MPRHQTPLYLHEEIMLLALRDEAGTVEFGSNYVYTICAAILAAQAAVMVACIIPAVTVATISS